MQETPPVQAEQDEMQDSIRRQIAQQTLWDTHAVCQGLEHLVRRNMDQEEEEVRMKKRES